jgi:hypothetical protein
MSFTHTAVSTFLTKEECSEILNFSLENLKLEPSQLASYGSDVMNTSVRKSNQVFYSYYKKFPFLLEKMTDLLNKHIKVKGFDLDYEKSEFQFTEYNKGDHFSWHIDTYGEKITNYDRYCSLVIQLNDTYEEGNLELKTIEGDILTAEKGIGNLILFFTQISSNSVLVCSVSKLINAYPVFSRSLSKILILLKGGVKSNSTSLPSNVYIIIYFPNIAKTI